MKPNKMPKQQEQKRDYQETDEHLRMKKGGKVKPKRKKQ